MWVVLHLCIPLVLNSCLHGTIDKTTTPCCSWLNTKLSTLWSFIGGMSVVWVSIWFTSLKVNLITYSYGLKRNKYLFTKEMCTFTYICYFDNTVIMIKLVPFDFMCMVCKRPSESRELATKCACCFLNYIKSILSFYTKHKMTFCVMVYDICPRSWFIFEHYDSIQMSILVCLVVSFIEGKCLQSPILCVWLDHA